MRPHRRFAGLRARNILLAALAVTTVFATSGTYGADYPVRPIRLIVAYPAGGNADLIARIIAQKMLEGLGQRLVVDNRGGAGGIIGESIAAKSEPDGYTILFVSLSHAVNPALHKKLPYDTINDFVPVALAASVPNVLVVHTSVRASSVPELIALAKANPGQLNYAASLGTSLHVSGELFKSMAGVDIVTVFYKSGGLAATDLEAGRVQMAFSAVTTAMSLVEGGRLRALAITSAKRSPALPALPAMSEFLPGYELTGWLGILAPSGTPPAIVARLNSEIVKAVRTRDVQERLRSRGADPVSSTPEEFSGFVKSEVAKMAQLLSRAGIRPK